MESPRIIVTGPRLNAAQPSEPGMFRLAQNRWDDYGYKTSYDLGYVNESGQLRSIGMVKILRRGQQPSDTQLLQQSFDSLPDDFVSLGMSLDYYQRMADMPRKDRDFILEALHDVLHNNSRMSGIDEEEGWRKSVLRDIDPNSNFMSMARIVLTQDYSALPSVDASFSFAMPGWGSSLEFSFDAPFVEDVRPYQERDGKAELPRRVSVVIGRNGSGKSTLLSRLARVAHASRRDRNRSRMSHIGTLNPIGLGFSRVITVSYSAFDNFQVPGMTAEDRRTIAQEISKGTGRFVFCGLRDIGAELEAELASPSAEGDIKSPVGDRQDVTVLKSANALAAEFSRIITRIEETKRFSLLRRALKPVLDDPSFNDVRDTLLQTIMSADCGNAFINWSTGHKIVLHVVCSLVAYVEKQALVLFDEPETHLHPPLLAALMHSLRRVLSEQEAYAVVATHSPVVLQETMAAHVHVISREGGETVVQRPVGETFGENIGLLTSNVFSLTSQVTDFNDTLSKLALQTRDLQKIEALFAEGGLSVQARAYVMAVLARQG
ncbi:AAA family ATPase [Paraburkholderia sp. MPAMCS5]|uniref:AAA family ATPase n=1 Tax=Paraburkholderia sp. MPAMCS5 TaxID=3112563 RepID=UPI002E186F49|nr:AAA family ATPase [Paraburkholderia sp. MPAMCS5]